MRISYEVSKAAFVSVLLFLVGIFCVVKGGGAIYHGHHALALSELDKTVLLEGSILLLVLFSLKRIGKWFIHSDLPAVVKSAHTFEKRTLHDDIEDCELRIAVLEDLLRKEK